MNKLFPEWVAINCDTKGQVFYHKEKKILTQEMPYQISDLEEFKVKLFLLILEKI
jgi:hypothetical protein